MGKGSKHLGLMVVGALLIAGAVLATLVLPGRAGWGDMLQASPTATPTRRPRLPTAQPLAPAPSLLIVATAQPTPAPTVAPASTSLPSDPAQGTALTPYLLGVVARYGVDPSRRFIVVDPDLQLMTVWEPGSPLRELPVSTGDETQGWRTAAWYGLVGRFVGTFSAFGVYADDAWYLFRDAGDILIHGAPYRLVDGQKHYEALDALGSYPASRGCVRLRPEDARWLTQWNPEGVPLVILPHEAAG